MKFYTITLLIFTIRTCLAQECNDSGWKKFDATVAKLMTIGNSGRRFPESKGQDLKIFCEQSIEYINEIDKFKTKCLKNLPRQVTGVLVYAVKSTIRQYCRKDSKKLNELLTSTPCANAASNEISKCYSTTIDSILGAKQAVETKRIPHLCCEYFKLYPCILDKTESVSECTPKKIEVISDFARTIFNNIVDLICGDYTENSDKCDKLEPPPKKRKNQKRTKSFAVPLIELLDSFPEV